MRQVNREPIRCTRCTGELNTHEAVCAECGETKWPTLAEVPGAGWRCALCRSGAGVGRRAAGRRGAAARAARKSRPSGQARAAGAPGATA